MANSSNSNDKKSQGGSQSEPTRSESEPTRSERLKAVKLPDPNEPSTHRRGDSADFSEGENKNSSSS